MQLSRLFLKERILNKAKGLFTDCVALSNTTVDRSSERARVGQNLTGQILWTILHQTKTTKECIKGEKIVLYTSDIIKMFIYTLKYHREKHIDGLL